MNTASALPAPAAGLPLPVRATPLRLAIAAVLLALVLRLIGIGMRPLWLDEAYSAWFASRGWHELWTVVPTYEPHPPFYYSLLKLWSDLFGGSAIALRAFSVLLGVATVPLVIAASVELERRNPSGRPLIRAGIPAFLVACSPMLVLLGQEARPYPLLIFAYALATLAVLRLMRELKAGSPGTWRSWLMLAAGTELGLWGHALGLVYALTLAATLAPAWLSRGTSRDRLLRGICTALLVLCLYLPCLWMMAQRAGDWGTGWLSWSPDMLFQLVGLYVVPVEVLTISSAVAALVMVLLAKRAIQHGLETPGWNEDRALLLLWWGPPIIAAVISQFAIAIFLPRTLAATLVPAYLLLGSALARVEVPRERFAFTTALVITLLPSALQIGLRPAPEPWDQVGAYLRTHVAAGDEVWLYPNDSALPLRAAGAVPAMRSIPGNYPAIGVKGPIRAGSPAVVSLSPDQARDLAKDPRAKQPATIWLVTRQSGLFDPHGDVPRALSSIRLPGRKQTWGYIAVQPYYRR